MKNFVIQKMSDFLILVLMNQIIEI